VGATGFVILAAVGAQAVIGGHDMDPAVSVGPSPAPSASPSPSPSPSPEDTFPLNVNGTYVPPLPTGEAPGVVTETVVLRLVPDAAPPATSGLPSESVACGTPVAGKYVDPIFDEAGARILKPDTPYPTFLDPARITEEGDVLLGLWSWGGDEVDRSYLAPAGEFLVAVSYLSQAIGASWIYDPATGYSGGLEVDYELVANQGVPDESDLMSGFSDLPNTIKLAFGTVLVQNGAIVGHTDYPAALDDGTVTMTINEVAATDGTTEIVYDFGVGPLEHVHWCEERPTGLVDAYAVLGVRPYTQEALVYSFIWAGQVEYK
jgi:hypothetical protein